MVTDQAGRRRQIRQPKLLTIGIEHEGYKDSEWTDAMYDSCTELFAIIAGRWDIPVDRDHIIGHREIYSLKSCPGSRVSIGKIIEMAKGKTVR